MAFTDHATTQLLHDERRRFEALRHAIVGLVVIAARSTAFDDPLEQALWRGRHHNLYDFSAELDVRAARPSLIEGLTRHSFTKVRRDMSAGPPADRAEDGLIEWLSAAPLTSRLTGCSQW